MYLRKWFVFINENGNELNNKYIKKKMRKLFCVLVGLVLANIGFGQNFQKEFNKYFDAGDTLKQREILAEWEKSNPQDPELFTSYFNYFFQKASKEIISLTTKEPKGEMLVITDSLGNIVGYMGSEITYFEELIQQGLNKIDEGIALYPNRLDMRFGKIYVLGQVEEWQQFTDEIVKAVQYSKINKNQWTWTNNEKRTDGEDFFLSSLQDYQLDLYNTEDDDLLPNMQTIANEILKIYPKHIESLSNLAITYLLTGQYDKGIEALLKAEKINPKDCVVLSNIAHGYKLQGDKQNAVKYYEKVVKYGDEEDIQYAKQQIEELKK